MSLTRMRVSNFTVFDSLEISLSEGINIFVGENGTGKTHVMKLLYAAAQAARKDIAFSHKVVRLFLPDDLKISRLARRASGSVNASVAVFSDADSIKLTFGHKTKKWEAKVFGEKDWERHFSDSISTFIPAKEILSNARNLESAVAKGNVDFDDTYIDIIAAAKIDVSGGTDPARRRRYLKVLRNITQSKVTVNEERFYLMPGNAKLEFPLVSEGIRKIALLWQLIKNGTLERGSILFWDEPEANINPIHIPIIVDMLLKLQQDGVQIFIATHDYVLAKYFEVKCTQDTNLQFYSLYFDRNTVKCEQNMTFSGLGHNPIMTAYNKLLDDVYSEIRGTPE